MCEIRYFDSTCKRARRCPHWWSNKRAAYPWTMPAAKKTRIGTLPKPLPCVSGDYNRPKTNWSLAVIATAFSSATNTILHKAVQCKKVASRRDINRSGKWLERKSSVWFSVFERN